MGILLKGSCGEIGGAAASYPLGIWYDILWYTMICYNMAHYNIIWYTVYHTFNVVMFRLLCVLFRGLLVSAGCLARLRDWDASARPKAETPCPANVWEDILHAWSFRTLPTSRPGGSPFRDSEIDHSVALADSYSKQQLGLLEPRAQCLVRRQWIPFGDHPSKLERCRED